MTNALKTFADLVAATRRVLNRQGGPVILVGHSYGGSVITEAGMDPKVAGLVYVACFAPEVGQSTLDQYAETPPPPNFVPDEQPDGFAFLNAERFRAGFADDASEADAAGGRVRRQGGDCGGVAQRGRREGATLWERSVNGVGPWGGERLPCVFP